MKSHLTFTEHDHSYALNSRKVPSVTRVISSSVEHWAVDPIRLEMGQVAHAAIALDLRDNLDLEGWKAELIEQAVLFQDQIADIVGRVLAVRKFRKDTGFKILHIETPMGSDKLHFAGRLDCIAESPDGKWCPVDWKRSLVPAVRVQLGAYSLLMLENFGVSPNIAAAIETKPTGEYKIVWGSRHPKKDNMQFNLTEAENVFRAMLSVHSWKQANKVKDKEEIVT